MQQKGGIKQILPEGRDQWLAYICCLLVFVGFSCSRAMMSIGLIGLMVTGLVFSDVKKTIHTFLLRPSYYVLTLFFVVILFSFFNSEKTDVWANFLRIKTPFLILPLAFCGMNFFDRKFFNEILFAFALCMTVSAAAVMGNYLMHYDDINGHILLGSTIPVPFSHIRYSLLLVLAVFVWLWLFEENFFAKRSLLLMPALFLIVVIHVLPSRSAWLALYICMLFYALLYIFRSGSKVLGGAILIGIIALPFLLYQVLPSFHNKIRYMQHTYQSYSQIAPDHMSDAMRLSSWQTGVEIIRQHVWTGVGVGDLQDECVRVSQQLFPNIISDDNRKMPHNEFIWIWAATGLFGFLAYVLAFMWPFIAYIRRGNWLFIVFHIIFFSSFISEYSLEEQVGTASYLLFLLIFLNYFNHQTTAGE